MKFFTYIFIFLFPVSGFLSTIFLAYGEKINSENKIAVLDRNTSGSKDSLPVDCPSSEKNTGSKDTGENSEISDYLKDCVVNSHLFQLHLPLSVSHIAFINTSLPSSFFEILVPPPEL